MRHTSSHTPLEAATRALSGRANLTLRVSNDPASGRIVTSQYVVIGGGDAKKPETLRGEADLAAMSLRFHNPKLHAKLRPNTAKSAQVFDTLERARHYGAMARDALGLFGDSALKSALLEAVDFAIDRAH